MLTALLGGDRTIAKIEGILDGLESTRSSSEKRIELLDQLERHFGQAVLQDGSSFDDRNGRSSSWWNAQSRPRTCIALALVSLLHRLHLTAQLSGDEESWDPGEEMTPCFTILQGLCLKDDESLLICSRSSTIHLVLAVLDAPYWNTKMGENQTIAHAIDFLICVTMASRSASSLFDELKGEEAIRTVMEQHTTPSASRDRNASTSTGRRTITLDEVQGNPIAIKCAEFLILFASERNEPGNRTVEFLGDQTSLFAETSIVHHLVQRRQYMNERESSRPTGPIKADEAVTATSSASSTETVIDRSRRARSMSPVKASEGKRRRNNAAAEERKAVKESAMTPRTRQSVPPLRVASLELSGLLQSPKRSYEPCFSAAAPSPAKSHSPPLTAKTPARRKDMPFPRPSGSVIKSRPLSALPTNAKSTPSSDEEEIKTMDRQPSPIKALYGPSPAVRRAHERSMSPDKLRKARNAP